MPGNSAAAGAARGSAIEGPSERILAVSKLSVRGIPPAQSRHGGESGSQSHLNSTSDRSTRRLLHCVEQNTGFGGSFGTVDASDAVAPCLHLSMCFRTTSSASSGVRRSIARHRSRCASEMPGSTTGRRHGSTFPSRSSPRSLLETPVAQKHIKLGIRLPRVGCRRRTTPWIEIAGQ